ncbi:hypothetical protein MMC07_001062 [Pseudocyphellaria aurata]|nr:hypothetical protein [Pseudocyphellaria aurata]
MPGYENRNGPVIGEFRYDGFRLFGVGALELLLEVADLVAPIMKRRGLQIGILCEFYPSDKVTMGQNHNMGEIIYLRLRDPDDEKQFILPIDRLVDALLHELAHNYHGKHDEDFQDIWYRLRGEYFEFRTYGQFLVDPQPSAPRSFIPIHDDDEGILR